MIKGSHKGCEYVEVVNSGAHIRAVDGKVVYVFLFINYSGLGGLVEMYPTNVTLFCGVATYFAQY